MHQRQMTRQSSKESNKQTNNQRNRSTNRKKPSDSCFPSFYQCITFLWLSALTYFIFCKSDTLNCINSSYANHVLPTHGNSQMELKATKIPTPHIESSYDQKTTTTFISTPEPTPIETPEPTKLTIYLLRTRESEGLSNFLEFLSSSLNFEKEILILEYNPKDEQFYADGKLVSQSKLQESITLYVMHIATPKITGTWNEKLYSTILERSNGNCVWTSIKASQPSEIAERPICPEDIESGVNLYSESYQLRKVLQFHSSLSDFIDDVHNSINVDKLKKVISAKENSLNL